MSDVKLMHGDCLDRMKEIEDGSIDMICADLPYGTTQCAWDVVIPFDQLWREYLRIAKPEAAIVLCAAQPFTSLMVSSNVRDYKYEWIWEKGAATGFLNAKKQPLRAHESAQVFYRKQPVYNPRMTTGHERKTSKRKSVESECYGKALQLTEYDSTERYPRSVQFFSSDKQTASYHPTQKPVAWMEFLIGTYTNPGQIVLDNTMGSGTTGVACVQLGRKFIGIERDETIFSTASARISEAITVRNTPVPQFDLFREAANGR